MAVSEVNEFNLTFSFKGREIVANCQKMKVFASPHIRVVVESGNENPDIYVFFQINKPKQKFFWFPLTAMKEPYAAAIAKELEKKVK